MTILLTILYSLPFLVVGLCDFQDDYSDLREAKWNLDQLTRLLCEAGKVYRGEKQPSAELLRWWMDHEAKDQSKL